MSQSHLFWASSQREDWATPQNLFADLDKEFGFNLDPCCLPETAKCERFFTPEKSGLDQKWEGSVYMNPPYGRSIGTWIKKAYEESRNGATVVCLLPANTDTSWFHDYCLKGEVRFLRGRLKFVGAKHSAPFPSMVVIFRPQGLEATNSCTATLDNEPMESEEKFG